MSFKIYTKTGDAGKTGLIGGTRVSKAHIRIESYGTVDELNSYIGLVGDLVLDEQSKMILKQVQDRLFTIGSTLATDPNKSTKMALPDLRSEDIALLETEIDRMTGELPELKSFILPGGHATVSNIHIARCVSRRAERTCVKLLEAGEAVDAEIIQYLNRLSDYLFTLGRYQAKLLNAPEINWKPNL